MLSADFAVRLCGGEPHVIEELGERGVLVDDGEGIQVVPVRELRDLGPAVEIRDANRALKSGEEVFKAQCTTCHTPGAAGAPKFGDVAAWSARITSGLDALVQSALKGKGAMPAKGGNPALSDDAVKAAVDYMVAAAK